MSVKLCINCKYMGRVTVDVAPGKLGRMDACLHPDFPNPINGNPLPVNLVREHDQMCTFKGKGFVQKQTEENIHVTGNQSLEDLPKQGRIVSVNDAR